MSTCEASHNAGTSALPRPLGGWEWLAVRVMFRIAVLILSITAALKLVGFFLIPVASGLPDSVIDGFTQREVILLAIVVETLIACCLVRWTDVISRSALLLPFCLCATIYHFGLSLQGSSVECPCLGIASKWMSAPLALGFSRVLVAILFTIAIATIVIARRASLITMRVGALTACVLLSILSSESLAPLRAQAAALRGVYTYIQEGKRHTNITRFEARFDEVTLDIRTSLTTGGPYGPAGPCESIITIDRDNLVSYIDCEGQPSRGVRLDSARLAWELGNCSTTVATAAFLAIRCTQLMPLQEATGLRTLAPTVTTQGEPLGAITMAAWQWHYTASGLPMSLTCNVAVDDKLLGSWHESPFLLSDQGKDDLRQKEWMLAPYKANYSVETLEFNDFNKIGNSVIPLRLETTQTLLIPPRTRDAKSQVLTSRGILKMTPILEDAKAVASLFPITGGEIHVADTRLEDRALKVVGAVFRTNRLESAAVSQAAVSDFELRKAKAQKSLRDRRVKTTLNWVLIAVILSWPAIYFQLQWSKRHTKQRTSE